MPSVGPRTRDRLSLLASVLVATLGLAFVLAVLVRERRTIGGALAGDDAWWLAVAFLPAAAAMLVISNGWGSALRAVGGAAPRGLVIARFFAGEIGKYAPGGVWPIVGRGELAARSGTPRSAAYTSVGLSLAGLYLACAAWIVVLAPAGDLGVGWVLLAVGALVAGLVGVRLRVRGVDLRAAMRVVSAYLAAWPLVGTATWCVARALGEEPSWAMVAAAAAVSWLVGFVTVPAPGGIGAREAAFVAVAALDGGVAAAIALVARLVFVVIDAAGWAVASVVLGARARQSMTTTMSPEPTD